MEIYLTHSKDRSSTIKKRAEKGKEAIGMAYWKTGHRKIDGHRRKVRLLHAGGKIVAVRRAGFRNLTDRQARSYGRKRVRRYTNNPEGARRRGGHVGYRGFGSLYPS